MLGWGPELAKRRERQAVRGSTRPARPARVCQAMPSRVPFPVGVLLGQIAQPYLSQTRGIRLILFPLMTPGESKRALAESDLESELRRACWRP